MPVYSGSKRPVQGFSEKRGKEDALYSPKKRSKVKYRSKESKRQILSGVHREDGLNGTDSIRLLPRAVEKGEA